MSHFGRFSLNTTLYYSLFLYYLSHSRESPREDEEGMKVKNKNKIRITGVFLIAVMSLSVMIILADTVAQAHAAKERSFTTSVDKIWEDDRLLEDSTMEDDRLHASKGPPYQYGAGGFGDIGAPRDLPF